MRSLRELTTGLVRSPGASDDFSVESGTPDLRSFRQSLVFRVPAVLTL